MVAQVLVLTSSQGISDEVVALVEQVLRDGGGQDLRPKRLSPDASEIAFDCSYPFKWTPISGIDGNVVAAADRQKHLLVADMDSTIINVECIDELADFAGVKDRVSAITERAMQGELDFEQAIFERVALLKDLPKAVLQKCFDERVRLNPGAAELVHTMNRNGAMTALVSGGFSFFTARVAKLTGFKLNKANLLLAAEGRLTGKVALPILGQSAKRETLLALRQAAGLRAEQTLAVGDGANDLAMISEAGLGVAFRAKPVLRAAANAVLDHSDLTALLALQGYARNESGTWHLPKVI